MHHTLRNFFDQQDIEQALREVAQLQQLEAFNRYDNPFEHKDFLEHKDSLPPTLHYMFHTLRSSTTCWWISKILQVPIHHADFLHYGGVFVYRDGDFLKPHVDAGIHPVKNLRKVATALLYLTPAELEFYVGTPCINPEPTVWSRNYYLYKPNDLVLFTNTDVAWHGVPTVHGPDRVVLTLSYLAPPEFSDIKFQNTRTRAYFAKTTWDNPLQELDALRELRASEQHHEEVYRL